MPPGTGALALRAARVLHGRVALGHVPAALAGHHPAPSAPAAPAGPDYETQLQSDPNYLAWQTNSIHNLSDAATSRRAALRALVEQFGGLPSGFADRYGDLSSADLSLASANPYSIQAGLARTYHDNVENMRKALAARGALHSGDLGYSQSHLDTDYGQQQYDTGRQFASQLQDAINSYTNAQAQDRADQAAAVAQAYQDITGNPYYVPGR